jgi:cytidine deaminase
MDERTWDTLKQAAREVRRNAYAPYSQFAVGAALMARSGAVFVGCNVENASFGATLCAERAALGAAVAAGERDFIGLAIASGAARPTTPCGVCRQCLVELAPSLPIRSYTDSDHTEYSLEALLPDAFGAEQLG